MRAARSLAAVVAPAAGGAECGSRQVEARDIRTARRREMLPWSEDVLVTRAVLQEKLVSISELRERVEQLKAHNAVQQRAKELAYQEKLAEVTSNFNRELDAEVGTAEPLGRAARRPTPRARARTCRWSVCGAWRRPRPSWSGGTRRRWRRWSRSHARR
jgi:hypothetical protein